LRQTTPSASHIVMISQWATTI